MLFKIFNYIVNILRQFSARKKSKLKNEIHYRKTVSDMQYRLCRNSGGKAVISDLGASCWIPHEFL